jgi:hypothetical protein
LLQRLVYGSGGVNWRGYIVFVLLVMERIGGRMSSCRVLVQEGVEFMLQEVDVEFRVGIVSTGEEIEVAVVVVCLGGSKKDRWGGGGGRGGRGRRRILERRRRVGVVYDI